MRTWHPSGVCPFGQCVIALEKLPDGSSDWEGNTQVVLLACAHHQGVRAAHGLSDAALSRAILQTQRVREAARWEVKLELGLDKEHPGVPYTLNADGSITILTEPLALAWRRDDRSAGPLPAIDAAARARARARAAARIAQIARPAGTAAVTVE